MSLLSSNLMFFHERVSGNFIWAGIQLQGSGEQRACLKRWWEGQRLKAQGEHWTLA